MSTDATEATLDLYARRKAAFLELVDLEPAARAARLDALARDDAALAADLRAQLAAADVPNAVLDRAGREAGPPELPQYRLECELGRGGMGVVWLAERRLGDAVQRVAIKQIAHARWSDEDLKRFQRERRILASLDHPNIAALVDGGADAHGAPYLATQYVDGERIDRWCAANGVELRGRVRLLRQVAGAVAYAHRKLVVHRDLKPANILVTRDGTPKLLDFGIARALTEEAVTTDGSSQMTLRYAAPEQVAGATDVGVASDVYSLGVLLYELVACDSPYGDATGPAAMMRAILQDESRAPSRAPRALAGVDRDLDAIVQRALRKSPAERYAGADAFGNDLDRWLAGLPVAARDGERGYHARKFVRRHWAALAATLVAIAALAVFAVYDLRATQARLAEVERERDKAQALARYFGTLFEGAPPADTARGEVTARALLETSVARLESDTSEPPATRATLLLAAASALSMIGEQKQAAGVNQRALELFRASGVDDAELEAAIYGEIAGDRYRERDFDGAKAWVAKAIALFESGRARDPRRRLTTRQQAAMYAEESGDVAAARAEYLRIIDDIEGRLDEPGVMRSWLAAHTNVALSDKDDPPAAAARLREALAVAERRGHDDPNDLLPMRVYLGNALAEMLRYDEALAIYRPTLVEARRYYSPNDQWHDVVVSSIARGEAFWGDTALGIRLLDESVAFRERFFGTTSPLVRRAREMRAIAALSAEQWADAEQRLAASIAELDAAERARPIAALLRAAHAYAAARRNPTPENLEALSAAADAAKGARGWRGPMVGAWREWAVSDK